MSNVKPRVTIKKSNRSITNKVTVEIKWNPKKILKLIQKMTRDEGERNEAQMHRIENSKMTFKQPHRAFIALNVNGLENFILV